jgi:predicted nicotinamide N-methyase
MNWHWLVRVDLGSGSDYAQIVSAVHGAKAIERVIAQFNTDQMPMVKVSAERVTATEPSSP